MSPEEAQAVLDRHADRQNLSPAEALEATEAEMVLAGRSKDEIRAELERMVGTPLD